MAKPEQPKDPKNAAGAAPQKSRMDILDERLKAVETTCGTLSGQMGEITKSLGDVKKLAGKGKSGLFGEHRERVAIKDTTTNLVYVSKSAVGKALGAEAGAEPGDHFAWYKLTTKFPDRFVPATAEEKALAEKAEAEELARIERESMEQLAAEAAAAATAAGGAPAA